MVRLILKCLPFAINKWRLRSLENKRLGRRKIVQFTIHKTYWARHKQTDKIVKRKTDTQTFIIVHKKPRVNSFNLLKNERFWHYRCIKGRGWWVCSPLEFWNYQYLGKHYSGSEVIYFVKRLYLPLLCFIATLHCQNRTRIYILLGCFTSPLSKKINVESWYSRKGLHPKTTYAEYKHNYNDQDRIIQWNEGRCPLPLPLKKSY